MSTTATETLWCHAGHLWERHVRPGSKPLRCPEHQRRQPRPPRRAARRPPLPAVDPSVRELYSAALSIALDPGQGADARAGASRLMRDLAADARRPGEDRWRNRDRYHVRALIADAIDQRVYGADHDIEP